MLRGNCLPDKQISIVITCEHGGTRFPKQFAGLFQSSRELLEGHRGYDPGALALAKKLSLGLKAPLYFSTLTRLLIDLNRSPHNPDRFSEITGRLGRPEKTVIQELYYRPYRDKVKSAFLRSIGKGAQALHLSVHTFTPLLHGKVRSTDLGFLYDPSRKTEALFCILWQRELHKLDHEVKTRRNYPYRGLSDGFTSYLREFFSEDSYLGIELEVNQKFLSGDHRPWLNLQQLILKSLDSTRNLWNAMEQESGSRQISRDTSYL